MLLEPQEVEELILDTIKNIQVKKEAFKFDLSLQVFVEDAWPKRFRDLAAIDDDAG